MPYLGRAPVGVAGNVIDGDLKVTGTISGESINHKLALNGSDASSPQANENDQFLFEDGGTDGSGTNAGDNLLLEDVTPSQAEVSLASISAAGTSGQVLQSQGSLIAPAFATAAVTGYSFVETKTADSDSNLRFEALSGDFDYMFILKSLNLSADAHLLVTIGTDTTYASTGYQSGTIGHFQENVTAAANDGSESSIQITAFATGAGSGEYIDGEVHVFNLADSSHNTSVFSRHVGESAGGVEAQTLSGGRLESSAANTDIKFAPASGNFTDGSISMFKRPNA